MRGDAGGAGQKLRARMLEEIGRLRAIAAERLLTFAELDDYRTLCALEHAVADHLAGPAVLTGV